MKVALKSLLLNRKALALLLFGLRNENDITELAEYCSNLSNVNLMGLMTMAPWTDEENIIRNSFISLRNIFIKLNGAGFKLTELSMGMTNDYDIENWNGNFW